jgi:hypothetical protein
VSRPNTGNDRVRSICESVGCVQHNTSLEYNSDTLRPVYDITHVTAVGWSAHTLDVCVIATTCTPSTFNVLIYGYQDFANSLLLQQ